MMIPPKFAHLALAVEPYIGMMLDRNFTRRNGFRVDILHGVINTIGADIRAVTEEGIERFWYSGCEVIPWGDIRRITIRSLDDKGCTVTARAILP